MKQLLWALAFLKIYTKETTLAALAKVDSKTYRKAVWDFIEAIAALETYVVSIHNYIHIFFI